ALVAGGRLECVRERVTEVEDRPAAPLVRVGDAHRRLEGRAAADELRLGELPELLAREQARLDDLRHPREALPLGPRLQERRGDHRAQRPVEGADTVLAAGKVDAGLAA